MWEEDEEVLSKIGEKEMNVMSVALRWYALQMI